MRWRAVIVTLGVAATMVAALPLRAEQAREPDWVSEREVYEIGGREVPASVAKVQAFVHDELSGPFPTSTSYIEFEVRTRHLERGHAYTVWLFVFNHPEYCTEPHECAPDDLRNPRTVASVMWGTGGVAKGAGLTVFRGTRRQGDPNRVIFGPGLGNTSGAQVQMIVRDHGLYDRETYGDRQTQTLNGGCPDDGGNDPGPAFDNLAVQNRCQDVQWTFG